MILWINTFVKLNYFVTTNSYYMVLDGHWGSDAWDNCLQLPYANEASFAIRVIFSNLNPPLFLYGLFYLFGVVLSW